MERFTATGASAGRAAAKALVFSHTEAYGRDEKIGKKDIGRELRRLESAFADVKKDIALLMEKAEGDRERELYAVELLMLEDPEYSGNMKNLIENDLLPSERAVREASEAVISVLSSLNDEYMRERRNDIRDIEMSLLSALSGRTRGRLRLTEPVILVADYLLTSEILSLEGMDKLMGIASQRGGRTSHVAIIARSHGIPAVTGINEKALEVHDGEYVALDGSEGVFITDPTDEMKREWSKRKEDEEAFRGNPDAVTLDGVTIRIKANIDSACEIETALRHGIRDIGLFRTEFMPGGINDGASYEKVLARTDGTVNFRTLDDGGDKGEDWKDDLLGLRAIRKSLREEGFFRSQLRAILRASAGGKASISLPFITNTIELRRALGIVRSVMAELDEKGIAYDKDIRIGAMIETPSAAIQAGHIAKLVDYVSIGTNDLTQYTVAAGRDDENVSELYQFLDPAVLTLVKTAVDRAHAEGVPVAICGEAATDELALPVLIGLGVDELSISPLAADEVRTRVGLFSSKDCEKLANEVISLADWHEAEIIIRKFINERES